MSLEPLESFPPQPIDDGETQWDIDSSLHYLSSGPGLALGICDSHETRCQSVHYDTYAWVDEEDDEEC